MKSSPWPWVYTVEWLAWLIGLVPSHFISPVIICATAHITAQVDVLITIYESFWYMDSVVRLDFEYSLNIAEYM